jgi:hypothetical protein
MSSGDRIAVVEWRNQRVGVFTIAGDFVAHVGVGERRRPLGIACSAFDELVVADDRSIRVVVFSAGAGTVGLTASGDFTGVTTHGGAVFAHDYSSSSNNTCIALT